MAEVSDPEIGQAAVRNKDFSKEFTRGRIPSDAVGPEAGNILDVGAYTGETALWFADLFHKAIIWAIEPFPNSFSVLASIDHSRIKPFQFAATVIDETVSLFANDISHTNGLLPINTESRDSIDISRKRDKGIFGPNKIVTSVDVRGQRVDTFVDNQGIVHIDLLKIDVQGFEVNVLQGSIGILNRVGVILVEVSLYDYYTESSSIGSVEEIIRPFGFQLWSITDVLHNPLNGRTDWVELLYRKQIPVE